MPIDSKILFLSGNDVKQLADWVEIVDALAQAYSMAHEGDRVPPRTLARTNHSWLRTLSGAPAGGRMMGAKLISASQLSGRASYLIALFDSTTSELVCLLDAGYLTGLRTAATSVLAVDRMARRDGLRIGVLGAGFEARNHLAALAALRKLDDVRIYSPTPASRERLSEEFSGAGTAARAVELPQLAVRGADVVVCAARSRSEQPIVDASWIEPGTVLVSIGSTLPEQREVGVDSIAAASVIVADMPEEVMTETGDLIAATQAGVRFRNKVISLGELVANPDLIANSSGIAMYKSVGSALQDITVAELLYEKALRLGLGLPLPLAMEVANKQREGTRHA